MIKKYVLLSFSISLLIFFAGCGNHEVNKESESFESETSNDIQFILEREVFYLKEESPSTYSNFINNIDNITSYKENWTFAQLLNDNYFQDINWTTNELDYSQKTITFSGISLKTPDNAKVNIVFYIQEQATIPLIWSLEIIGDESNGNMSIQDYIDMGLDNTESLFAIDASASCSIALLCDQTITKENDDIQSAIPDTQEDTTDNDNSTETTNDYYINEQGILVDKVIEFETQTFGDYTLKYPILNEGTDEVVVYEFDTYDGVHIIIDASNVYQQTSLDEIGDYGDVLLTDVAPGRDIAYMFDGECYYIEDYSKNLLTISKPINN